jgi:hypothetical protein
VAFGRLSPKSAFIAPIYRAGDQPEHPGRPWWTEGLWLAAAAGALLDRRTQHVHIMEMNVDSYRLGLSAADIWAHADMPAAVPRQWTACPAAGEASGAILPWHATCLLYDYTDRPDRTDKTGRNPT